MIYAYQHEEDGRKYITVIAVCERCGEINPVMFEEDPLPWRCMEDEFRHQRWDLYMEDGVEAPSRINYGKNESIKATCACDEDPEYIVAELVDGKIEGMSSDYGSVRFRTSQKYIDTWVTIIQALCDSVVIKGNCELRIGPKLAEHIRNSDV